MDTHEIIRQIESDPALAAELRAVLLGDAFIDLPSQVTENTRAIASLTERVDRLTERVEHLDRRVDKLTDQMADVRGWQLEHKVTLNPLRYLYGELSQVKLVRGDDLEKLITKLDRRSPLSPEEKRRLVRTDLIVHARSGPSQARVTVVAEISATVHLDDVDRAHESARILSERGHEAAAVVLGANLGGDDVARDAAAKEVQLLEV